MMKKVLKIFIYVMLFFIAFLVFLPKESLYNFLEKELEKKQIIVSNEIRDEKLFALEVSKANLYFEKINIGKFEELTFESYLIYTKVNLKQLSFMDSFSSFLPTPIENVSLKHSILDLNTVKIESNGTFGELSGEINIFSNSAKLYLIPSKMMKDSYSKLLRNMKLENGVYIYEYKF